MRYVVATHHGGCSWWRIFDARPEAEAYKAEQERTVGDSESWREGVTSVSLREHDGPWMGDPAEALNSGDGRYRP